MENKKTKGKLNKKKLAIVGIVFLVFILIYFIQELRGTNISFTVKRGRFAEEETVRAICIRREEVLGEDKNKRLEKIASEGTRVAKGDDIFRYYSNDEANIIKKIDEINNEINKYLNTQKINLNSRENQVINEQIRKIIDESLKESSQEKIKNNLNNINLKLKEKAKDGEIFKNDENIKKLNSEKTRLEEGLTKNTKKIKAPFAGIVSYKVDGYESKLSSEKIDALSSNDIKDIDVKPGIQIATSETNGKIVDNFIMYLAVESTNKEMKGKKAGDKIGVRIFENIVRAEIVKVPNKNIKNDKTMVLKITDNVERLIDTRCLDVDLIWWESEGLMISNKAIEKENGFSFVEKNKWTYKERVMIKIVRESDEMSLVENYTSDELKEMGLDISGKRPGIQEDDEIIISKKKKKASEKEKIKEPKDKIKEKEEQKNKTNKKI